MISPCAMLVQMIRRTVGSIVAIFRVVAAEVHHQDRGLIIALVATIRGCMCPTWHAPKGTLFVPRLKDGGFLAILVVNFHKGGTRRCIEQVVPIM